MAEKLTHEEFDRQVEEAMNPPVANQGAGQGFSPGIQKMRQSAKRRRPIPAGRNRQIAG